MPAENQAAANYVFASGHVDALPVADGDRRFAVITCGPENVANFNARMREEIPEAFELAKALRSVGLIDGLRGARIGPAGSLGWGGVVPQLSGAAESRLSGDAAGRKGAGR